MDEQIDTSDVDYDQPAVLPDDWDAALDRLDWHARRVRQQADRLVQLEAQFTREMDRLRRSYDEHRQPIQARLDWHKAPIESFHRMLHAHDQRVERTLRLPNGVSKLRVPKDAKVEFGGDLDYSAAVDAVTGWARTAHPEILRSPNITDVRKVVQVVERDDGTRTVIDPATGEVVPGVQAVTPAVSWSLDTEPGGWL